MEAGRKIRFHRIFFATLMTLVLCSACMHVKKIPAAISQLHPQVAEMVSSRSQSQATVMALYINDKEFVKHVFEGKSKGQQQEIFKVSPKFYVFEDSAVSWISCTFRDAAKDTSAYSLPKLIAILGSPQGDLPAALGQPFRMYVYPRLGLAFAVNMRQNYYYIVDVFQPTSLKKYKLYFWNDPSQYPSRHR